MKKLRILLPLLAAVVLAFTGCSGTNETPPADMAVTFSTTALDGTPVTQDFFKEHKVNFVHYWATWCGPCVGELPELPELYEKYKDSVGFLAIVDDAADQEGIDAAKQILADSGVTFTNVVPFDQVEDIFGRITGVPCTMLVDEHGKPLGKQILGAVGIEEYSRQLDAALEAAG